MSPKHKKPASEPSMSDKTLIVNVEELINRAFGKFDENTVNLTLIQTILFILARQLRMLEQEVEIKFDDRGFAIDKFDKVDDTEESDTSAMSTGMVQGSHGKALTDGARKDGKPDGARKDGASDGARKDGARKDGAGGSGRSDGVSDGGGGIIPEKSRRKSKHEPRPEPERETSIQLITGSQFALLEETVRRLQEVTGPPPTPTMPGNEQLRDDLAKGRASLSDTMLAMQLSARMKGAEDALSRMSQLLAQLAAKGVLPEQLAAQLGEMRGDLIKAAGSQAPPADGDKLGVDSLEYLEESDERPVEITRQELEKRIQYTKGEVRKNIEEKFGRAHSTADTANKVSLTVSAKLDIALKLDDRISNLTSLTAENVLRVRGFDSSLRPQMAIFEEALALLKNEMAASVALFGTANNNAEAAALVDMNERCESIALELETKINQHKSLDLGHAEFCKELKGVINCVEMLREQKADREEVTDGLRDKADLASLVGMLQETDFAIARLALDQKLAKSQEQFYKLDSVWQNVLKELMVTVEEKADYINVVGFKIDTEEQLTKGLTNIQKLEVLLGEPEAAILMRHISEDASCGACLTRALIEPKDRTYGMPIPLPALRPAPPDPRLVDASPLLTPPDLREHTCLRWVGGSHTLLHTVAREKANLIKLQLAPTRKFAGYGDDGRLYLMEEEVPACAECNQEYYPGNVSPHVSTPTDGGGDQACR